MALAPSVAQAAGTLAINADGDTVTWQTTGDVGQRWGLYLRHRRSTPAPVTAWSYKGATLGSGGTTFWAQHGAGTYDVQVCEYDPFQGVLTTCSNQVEVTWVTDVNGHFGAIPAADPALETGTLALEADGEHLTWGVTGTLGQASGFLLFTDGHAHWLPGATRSTDWMPAGGWQPGMFELSLCAYDHYRNAVGTCSNTVEVEVAINGFGQAAPVPQADPADEVGTITTWLEGCELAWETTQTVGSTTGFMVLSQQGGEPAFGASASHYAWPLQRAQSLDDLAAGRVDADEVVARLRRLPFADLGFARVDHHRALRQGLHMIARIVCRPWCFVHLLWQQPAKSVADADTSPSKGQSGPIPAAFPLRWVSI